MKTKDDFLRLAEEWGITPTLYRVVNDPQFIVQAFPHGHLFYVWNPYKKEVKEIPFWGDSIDRIFRKIDTRPTYQNASIDTQAR